MDGRTLTPKRRVSSVHGGWATAAAVAAMEAHLVAAAAALVVAVVVEATAAAGERHLPAVVVAARLQPGGGMHPPKPRGCVIGWLAIPSSISLKNTMNTKDLEWFGLPERNTLRPL